MFLVLVPIFNRKKEECHKDFDVVMRHDSKSWFSVKRTEREGDFKSIMGEVYNEMILLIC